MPEKQENVADVLVFPVWVNTIVTCTNCGGDRVLTIKDAPRVKLCSGSTYYFSCEKCGMDTHFRK